MRSCRWLLSGLLLVVGSVAHAEGGCLPGYYPYPMSNAQGQPGPQACAPIPGYNNNQLQAQPQRPPPSQWVSRWGAIATDAIKGALGTAIDVSSSSEAEQIAMADCEAKGGTQCKIDVSYGNGCAALVAGSTGYAVHNAATLNEAIKLATKTCSSGDSDCHVYYSACSLPVQIR